MCVVKNIGKIKFFVFGVSFEGFFLKRKNVVPSPLLETQFFLSQQSCVFTKKMLWILYINFNLFFGMHFQMPDENIEDIQCELTETVLTKKLKYIAFNLFFKGNYLCSSFFNLKNKHKQIT
jgi:hypothetical protein